MLAIIGGILVLGFVGACVQSRNDAILMASPNWPQIKAETEAQAAREAAEEAARIAAQQAAHAAAVAPYEAFGARLGRKVRGMMGKPTKAKTFFPYI